MLSIFKTRPSIKYILIVSGGFRMSDTKEKILNTALELFSHDGYEAVSVSDIAGKLNMTKGALYKHYINKRDIFDCIVARMEQVFSEFFSPAADESAGEALPESISPVLKAVLDYCSSCFLFWTGNQFASSFRKMLALEQYRSEEMGRLYRSYLVSAPVEKLTEMLRSFRIGGAAEKAVSLYSTIYFFFSVYDGAEDKMCTSAILKESIERLCFNIIR